MHEILGKFKPLSFITAASLLVYKKQKLYAYDIDARALSFICKLPAHGYRKVASKFRLTERVFRTEPRTAVKVSDQLYLISMNGAIYNVNLATKTLDVEWRFREGINNPLALVEIRDIAGFEDSIVYGEYSLNLQKKAMAIYARDFKEGTWRKKYEFPDQTIAHVHNLIPDKMNDRVLILTGDASHESGIWAAYDDFSRVEPLAIGAQKYRSCCAYPTKNGILYASDSNSEENHIFLYKEHDAYDALDALDAHEEQILFDLNGPSVFSTQIDDKFVFATDVEGNSKKKDFRRFFNNKIGEGVKSREMTLVIGNHETGFETEFVAEKDNLPFGLFQFGNFIFPSGEQKLNRLVFYAVGAKKIDGRTLLLDVERGA